MGDLVSLHEDEDFVREQFRIFYNGQIVWTEGFARSSLEFHSVYRSMLGETFPVVSKEVTKEDNNWVGLPSNDHNYGIPSNDGDYGSTYYFPKTTLRKSKSFLI